MAQMKRFDALIARQNKNVHVRKMQHNTSKIFFRFFVPLFLCPFVLLSNRSNRWSNQWSNRFNWWSCHLIGGLIGLIGCLIGLIGIIGGLIGLIGGLIVLISSQSNRV